MSLPKYTVYAVDRSGNSWDVLLTSDPFAALAALEAERKAHPDGFHGVYETDEPEHTGVEEALWDEIDV